MKCTNFGAPIFNYFGARCLRCWLLLPLISFPVLLSVDAFLYLSLLFYPLLFCLVNGTMRNTDATTI